MTSANSTSITQGRAIWRDARWAHAIRNCGVYAAAGIVRLKALAPYALIELILPGGSVMALLLWLYRRRKNGVGFGRVPVRLLSLALNVPSLLSDHWRCLRCNDHALIASCERQA